MNSIAPISSLSETFLKRKDVVNGPLYDGIRASHETSTGVDFVCRQLPQIFSLTETFSRTFLPDGPFEADTRTESCARDSGTYFADRTVELMLYADPNLIRQVLINILKNAVQSIGGNKGRIHIRAYSAADEHVFIYISNDGPVIPEEEAEQIFVPFFTTRINGSGIGLSLSRQIMKLSGGSISLLRAGTNGWNTTFVLEFE